MKSATSLMRLLKVRYFVVVALGVFTLLASVRVQGATPPPPRGTAPTCPTNQTRTSQTQPARPVIPFDVRWLQSNINLHNRMLVQTKVEAALTTSSVIKAFCADLGTTLTAEVTQLQTALKTWYGIVPPTMTALPPAARDSAVVALASQDLIFLNQVILYEHSIIMEGLYPASKATHADLKAIAKKQVVGAQSVLLLVEAWQDVLIKSALDQLFK